MFINIYRFYFYKIQQTSNVFAPSACSGPDALGGGDVSWGQGGRGGGTITRRGLTLSDKPCQVEFAEEREMFAG